MPPSSLTSMWESNEPWNRNHHLVDQPLRFGVFRGLRWSRLQLDSWNIVMHALDSSLPQKTYNRKSVCVHWIYVYACLCAHVCARVYKYMMHACICVCLCVIIYLHGIIHMYLHVCACAYYVHVWVCEWMCVWLCVHVCVCVCVCDREGGENMRHIGPVFSSFACSRFSERLSCRATEEDIHCPPWSPHSRMCMYPPRDFKTLREFFVTSLCGLRGYSYPHSNNRNPKIKCGKHDGWFQSLVILLSWLQALSTLISGQRSREAQDTGRARQPLEKGSSGRMHLSFF